MHRILIAHLVAVLMWVSGTHEPSGTVKNMVVTPFR